MHLPARVELQHSAMQIAPRNTHMRHPLTHRALRTIIVTSCLLFLCAGAAFGQAAAGYSEYFLPGDEQNMYFIFNDLDTNAGPFALRYGSSF